MYTAEGQFFNYMNTKTSKKIPLIGSIFAGILIGICLLAVAVPETTNADLANTKTASYMAKASNEVKKAAKTIKVVITAYSSTPDQTDDTPFITASGKHVRAGIIANNMLPLGTKVKIPKLYGNQVFVVEDRMASYKSKNHIDIWMPTRPMAVKFGVKNAEMEVLEN